MTAAAKGKPHARLMFTLRIVAGLAILFALLRFAGWSEIASELQGARWRWICLVYVSFAVMFVLNARLQLNLLRGVGLTITAARVMLAKFQSSFFGLILPGEIFAGAVKWANLAAATGDRSRVLVAMLANKVLLALPPLCLGCIALAWGDPLGSKTLQWIASVIAVALLTGLSLFFHKDVGAALERLSRRFVDSTPRIFRAGAHKVLDGFHELRELKAIIYLPAIAVSVAIFALSISSMAFATLAVGAAAPIYAFFWTSMILFFSRLLPISVGNIGIREGVLTIALGFYGVSAAKAVLVGLILFSSTLIVATLGAGYQVALIAGWVRWRGENG